MLYMRVNQSVVNSFSTDVLHISDIKFTTRPSTVCFKVGLNHVELSPFLGFCLLAA